MTNLETIFLLKNNAQLLSLFLFVQAYLELCLLVLRVDSTIPPLQHSIFYQLFTLPFSKYLSNALWNSYQGTMSVNR